VLFDVMLVTSSNAAAVCSSAAAGAFKFVFKLPISFNSISLLLSNSIPFSLLSTKVITIESFKLLIAF